MCKLYFVPNLLVIQHLETLYLGGNNIRVVCERVWIINQVRAPRGNSRLDLTTNSQVVTQQNVSHMWSMQEVEGSGQLDHYRIKSTAWPFCYLAIGTHNSSQSRVYPVLLKTDFSHSFSYPTINTLISMKCRELSERILREKPQKTTRLIHPQSYPFDSLNSSTFTLSIDIPMRGS